MLFAGESEAGRSAPPLIFLYVTLKHFPVLPDSSAVFLLCFSHAQQQRLSAVSLPEYDVSSQLISLIYQSCTPPLSLFTWVSSTNWANCQGSMKHKLEMPRATMAVLPGFRTLRKTREGGGKNRIQSWESRRDKRSRIKMPEKTETFNGYY